MGNSNFSKIRYNDEFPKCLKFLNNNAVGTRKAYIQSINKYQEFHQMSIEDLVIEALEEQTNHVPQHLLKVIDRIEDFQEFLISEEFIHGTILTHMSHIKAVYRKNRVVLPYIEPLNPKRTKRNPVIEFSDVLTKDELRKSLPLLRLPVRARVMVMIQGGLSNEECEHLTTRAFIDELRKYHQKDDDVEALRWLANEDNPVIWVTKLIRIKTGKPYYALIGSEAVNVIASAKLYEKELPSNHNKIPDKLLNVHKSNMNRICSKINRRLGFGTAGGRYRFRPHAFRRFHATYIDGSALTYEEQSIISYQEIDEMQGRGKTSVQDTYIKTNPLKQKILYAKVMNNVSLWHEYEYEIVDDDVLVTVKNQMLENKRLSKRIKELDKIVKEKKEVSKEVDALIEDFGEDKIKEIIGGILNPK